MALKLRLTRMGSKKKPFYRIIAVNSETRRDGRALDYVGYYNPMTQPEDIKIDQKNLQLFENAGIAVNTDQTGPMNISVNRSVLSRKGNTAV